MKTFNASKFGNNYSIQISPAALNYIDAFTSKEKLTNYSVVIADTHCCGGILNVEIQNYSKTKEDLHLIELFPKNSDYFPFSIWVEQQAMREFSIPEQILVDLNPFSKPPRLEVKNGRFEEPY